MGGGRKKWQTEEWPPSWQQAEDWRRRLWSGAWSASPKAQNKAAASRYDSVQVPHPKQNPGSEETEPQSAMGAFHREVQRVLTTAKKADVKLRKLNEERQRRGAQWSAWAKEQKEKFLTQKRQYEADLDRIQNDIATVTAQGREASEAIRTLIARGTVDVAEPMETNTAWEDMIEQQEDDHLSGFFQEALLAARRAGSIPGGMAYPRMDGSAQGMISQATAARLLAAAMSGMPPGPSGLGHPPPGLHPSAATNIHAEAASHGSTATDPVPIHKAAPVQPPYETSPSSRPQPPATETSPNLSHPQASPSAARRPRVPVKGAPVKPVHTGVGLAGTLAGKLEEKRAAMRPFGGLAHGDMSGLNVTLNGQPIDIDIDTGDEHEAPEPTAVPAHTEAPT